MALKAVFVGINKHQDPAIPELSGAKRDATALWALFSDSVEGLAARLLVDEDATHEAVSGAAVRGRSCRARRTRKAFRILSLGRDRRPLDCLEGQPGPDRGVFANTRRFSLAPVCLAGRRTSFLKTRLTPGVLRFPGQAAGARHSMPQ